MLNVAAVEQEIERLEGELAQVRLRMKKKHEIQAVIKRYLITAADGKNYRVKHYSRVVP